MKYLVLSALCASFSAIAQSPLKFNLATSGPAFHDADVGAMTLADVDNDGDLDAFNRSSTSMMAMEGSAKAVRTLHISTEAVWCSLMRMAMVTWTFSRAEARRVA
jgi:hypothetical protein